MLHLKPYFFAILVGFTLLLGSCGQTGDLYLPEEEAKEPELKAESKKEKSKN